jgi:hypothetical protein
VRAARRSDGAAADGGTHRRRRSHGTVPGLRDAPDRILSAAPIVYTAGAQSARAGPNRKDDTMKHMVRYTLKPDRAAENERLVAAVYDELSRVRPPGLRYATLRLADGLGYVHLVSHENAGGPNALTALESFKAFSAGIRQRCAEPPARSELIEI